MKIKEIQGSDPSKTICVVAHQDEIKGGLLDEFLPAGLAQSKEFRQDLNMSGSFWFYNSVGRFCLVQKPKDKDDAKEDAIRGSYKKVGATAATALMSKKVASVEILVTAKVTESNMFGVF